MFTIKRLNLKTFQISFAYKIKKLIYIFIINIIKTSTD
jgi:hypothetical protein